MYDLIAVVVLLLLVTLFIRYQRRLSRAAAPPWMRTVQRDLTARGEPQLSEARRAGFALNDAINAAGDVESAAREAAQAALAVCRETDREPLTEALRGRVDIAAAAAEAAAEHATALAGTIRLHHAEIMRAAESSPLKLELLNLAGSEAMEYRLYAEDTASSLDDLAKQARRAAAEARARGSGLSTQ